MRINYNATAMQAVNRLNINDENLSVSTGKLSSGYKINRAKDNPSGYAMSRKMRAQLEGLMQARDNSDTGVNILKAVDGALSEVHDMLQRLNELAIKGANGTLSEGDRELVDEEVQKLKEEIQRISETFEFNGQKLLDGSFQLKGYTENINVKVAGYDERLKSGHYTFDLSMFKDDIEIELPGTTETKKSKLYDDAGNFNAEDVYALFKKKIEVPADPNDETKAAIPDPDGKEEGLGYKIDDPLGGADQIWVPLPEDWSKTIEVNNPNAKSITVTGPDDDNKKIENVYVSDANGTILTLKGPSGFEVKLDIRPEFIKNPGEVEVNLTGIGPMTIQVGANEGQEVAVEIPNIGIKGLGIDTIKTTTKADSLEAITRVSVAVNRLSSIRSKIGAYQNRLESIVESNEINHENMTGAYSNILDTDMSEEYTKYATYQVLSQASTSVLAQANERPSQVLQLLQ